MNTLEKQSFGAMTIMKIYSEIPWLRERSIIQGC